MKGVNNLNVNNMISIFNTGGLTLAVTIFWLALSVWFGYQAYKAHNSGWTKQVPGGIDRGNEKIPYYKIPQVWGIAFITVLYVVALLLIASDYKGV